MYPVRQKKVPCICIELNEQSGCDEVVAVIFRKIPSYIKCGGVFIMESASKLLKNTLILALSTIKNIIATAKTTVVQIKKGIIWNPPICSRYLLR